MEGGQRECQRWGVLPSLHIWQFLEVGNRELGVWSKLGRRLAPLWSVGDHTLQLARWSHEEEVGAQADHRCWWWSQACAHQHHLSLDTVEASPHSTAHPPQPPVYRFVVKYLALHTFSILSSPSPIYKKFSSSSSPFQKCINCHPSQTNRSWS